LEPQNLLILDFINSLEEKLKNLELTSFKPQEELHLLNSLIQAKCLYYDKPSSFIYSDLKQLVKAYCQTTDTNKFEYDKIDFCIIEKLITPLSRHEKLAILGFTRRELLKIHDLASVKLLEPRIRELEYQLFISSKTLSGFVKGLFLFPTINFKNLLITFFLIFILCSLVLLPSTNSSWETFRFNKVDIVGNETVDHFLNTLIFLFKLDSSVSVNPISMAGVIVSVILKSFFVLFIVNYLIKFLAKHLSLEI